MRIIVRYTVNGTSENATLENVDDSQISGSMEDYLKTQIADFDPAQPHSIEVFSDPLN